MKNELVTAGWPRGFPDLSLRFVNKFGENQLSEPHLYLIGKNGLPVRQWEILAGEVRIYNPLQESGLFRIFASIDHRNTSEIEDFANSWGPLIQPFIFGEPLSFWQDQIAYLKRCVWLLDAVKSEKVLVEDPLINLEKFLNSEEKSKRKLEEINSKPGPKTLHWSPLPLKRRAWNYLQNLINEQVGQHGLTCQVSANFTDRFDPLPMTLNLYPENLISALWFQIARAVSGEKDYKCCLECGKPFEISLDPEGFRKNRMYCSDACRQKAYRRRKSKPR